MARIYVSQILVDDWLSQGRIALNGDVLEIDAGGTPASLHIHPAVYFEHVDGAEADPHQVVGCVKTSDELAQMGAEHYDTSVVMGDHAYTVKPGFIATPIGSNGAEPSAEDPIWGRVLGAFSALYGF